MARKTRPIPDAAQAVYDETRAITGSKRSLTSLDNVWQALLSLHARGAEIRVSAVSLEIEDLGLKGPADRTIRNPKGQLYRTLIEAFVGAQQPKVTRGQSPLHTEITDPSQRGQVKLLEQELRSTKGTVDALRAYIAKMEATITPEGELSLPPGTSVDETTITLSGEDRRRFKEFLDKTSRLGDTSPLRVTVTGALHLSDGDSEPIEIAPPFFMNAMRNLIGNEVLDDPTLQVPPLARTQ